MIGVLGPRGSLISPLGLSVLVTSKSWVVSQFFVYVPGDVNCSVYVAGGNVQTVIA